MVEQTIDNQIKDEASENQHLDEKKLTDIQDEDSEVLRRSDDPPNKLSTDASILKESSHNFD